MGKGKELDARAAEGLGGVIAAEANAAGHTAVTVVVDPVKGSRLSPAQIAAHIALGVRLRSYRFDKYKTKDKPEQKLSLQQLTIVLAGPADARKAYAQLEPVVDAVFLTRDLVSEPPNVLYPVEFARRAKELTKLGVKVEILGEAEMKKLGMETLLAVGQGSARDSQLLVMTWMNGAQGPGAGSADRQGRVLRHRWYLAEAGGRHGRHEVGHGRRRRGNRCHEP